MSPEAKRWQESEDLGSHISLSKSQEGQWKVLEGTAEQGWEDPRLFKSCMLWGKDLTCPSFLFLKC
jgi:hypothetical protein